MLVSTVHSIRIRMYSRLRRGKADSWARGGQRHPWGFAKKNVKLLAGLQTKVILVFSFNMYCIYVLYVRFYVRLYVRLYALHTYILVNLIIHKSGSLNWSNNPHSSPLGIGHVRIPLFAQT